MAWALRAINSGRAGHRRLAERKQEAMMISARLARRFLGWLSSGVVCLALVIGAAPASHAAVVHLDAATRWVEADVNVWADLPVARYESSVLGPVDWWLWVDNRPTTVVASVNVRQITDIGVDDDALYLRGSFVADPYWYWYIQRESYAIGAAIDFTIDAPANWTLSASHTCYYWRAPDGYCPTWNANFTISLTGGAGPIAPGRLEPGSYRFVVSSYDDNPWNGVQTMNFDFALQALAVPVPAPASAPLVWTALALLALLGQRRQARRGQVLA
jgi:hypothetical protein